MHFLDAISAHQFPSSNLVIYRVRAQNLLYSHRFLVGNGNKGWAFNRWNSIQVPKRDKTNKFGGFELNEQRIFVIRAVATLEPKCTSAQIGDLGNNLELGNDLGSVIEYSNGGESEEVGEKEKLRRMRISKANKGNTPWNLGKKHSPETLRRIRERTRIAMQSPKVKMKLINFGHSQSKETRAKIGVGVRAGWEKRRERLKLQETCYFEWQNLIAESSRRGLAGEIELQWDSYKILDKELSKEWQESVEQRKSTPRPKGNKRAPKSPEQRRKISEAISAKWADAGYRDRVVSALSKYYGTQVGEGKKPRRRSSGVQTTRVGTATKKKAKDTTEKDNSSKKASSKRRSNTPTYKDPLASSKLEMIKNIRTRRAAAELEKTQAFKQAKLLIWEAERAAKALEESAMRSPLAQASLLESRELIAQAIQSLNSIENKHVDDMNSIVDVEENDDVLSQTHHVEGAVNGFSNSSLMGLIGINSEDEASATDAKFDRLDINRLSYGVEDEVTNIIQNGCRESEIELDITSPLKIENEKEEYASAYTEEQLRDQLVRLNGRRNSNELLQDGSQVVFSSSGEEDGNSERFYPKTSSSTKKWVRGRLIEIEEEED